MIACYNERSIYFSKGFLKYSQNGRSIQPTEPGGKPKIYRDGSLLTKSDGQWNGAIVNVSFFLQEEIKKPFEKVRARFCLSCFKEFFFFLMACAILSAGHSFQITLQSIRFQKTEAARAVWEFPAVRRHIAMGIVVIQWYVAKVAGYSEIVANPPRFLRRKKLLFRSSFVLPSEIRFTLQSWSSRKLF